MKEGNLFGLLRQLTRYHILLCTFISTILQFPGWWYLRTSFLSGLLILDLHIVTAIAINEVRNEKISQSQQNNKSIRIACTIARPITYLKGHYAFLSHGFEDVGIACWSSCTDHICMVFPQYECACVLSNYWLEWKSSCIGHIWTVSRLNGSSCGASRIYNQNKRSYIDCK